MTSDGKTVDVSGSLNGPQGFAPSPPICLRILRRKAESRVRKQIGGEGWGEGVVFLPEYCKPNKPPHPACRPPSPPIRGRRDVVEITFYSLIHLAVAPVFLLPVVM